MARHTHASYRCTGRTVVRLDCAQGMTEVRLNVRTSSSPIGIKPPILTTRQERTPFLSHSLSRSFFFLPSKGRRTDLHSPLTWASEGPHRANLPPFLTRPVCRTINPRVERDRRKDKPIDDWELTTERWIQPRSEIQILIDVGELAYSTENRSETQHTTSLGVMQSPSSLEDHERSYNDKARIVRDMPVRGIKGTSGESPGVGKKRENSNSTLLEGGHDVARTLSTRQHRRRRPFRDATDSGDSPSTPASTPLIQRWEPTSPYSGTILTPI
ncbi:hypothetical protein GW17_00035736 [Ensete ventricosum]|nr:hypothetical protein GW17_00035736 [Ensete ventricosum]